MRSASFRVRAAQPIDIPALMRLKRLLAQGEDSLHAVRAGAADWLRDGFGADAGFSAFVAEAENAGTIVGMATCSQRIITGWNGPVIFLAGPLRRAGLPPARRRRRAHGAGRGAGARHRQPDRRADGARRQPGASFYQRAGFALVPQCLTYVLAGPALAALAARDREEKEKLALAG